MRVSEDLGAQYREARDAIGVHRQRQARAEVVLHEALEANSGNRQAAAVMNARVMLDRAVADVEWCRAVTVAAGEAFKGISLEEALIRNDANRDRHGSAVLRERALLNITQSEF